MLTDCTEDNVQKTHTYTQYTQCTIKTYFVINTHYTLCVHILHYVYIVICEGATDYTLYNRLYIIQQISCAKVQQIIHMQCRGCGLYGIQ